MSKPAPAGMSDEKDPKRIEVASTAIDAVQAILLEEISLAKPDDLAFLESQVPRIAHRIVGSLTKASQAVTEPVRLQPDA